MTANDFRLDWIERSWVSGPGPTPRRTPMPNPPDDILPRYHVQVFHRAELVADSEHFLYSRRYTGEPVSILDGINRGIAHCGTKGTFGVYVVDRRPEVGNRLTWYCRVVDGELDLVTVQQAPRKG